MDLAKYDETDPLRKSRRHTRRLAGRRYKTIIWFEEVGAERIPQKSIKIVRSAYKKTIREYWRTLCPDMLARAQRMRVYTDSGDDNV
jgi:hypothetical protein